MNIFIFEFVKHIIKDVSGYLGAMVYDKRVTDATFVSICLIYSEPASTERYCLSKRLKLKTLSIMSFCKKCQMGSLSLAFKEA